MTHNMRFVQVKGEVYYRAEDVAAYLRVLSSTEETDVRTRLDDAAARLIAAKEQPR